MLTPGEGEGEIYFLFIRRVLINQTESFTKAVYIFTLNERLVQRCSLI